MSGDGPTARDLRARCEREIFSLHAFFEQWFTGEVPGTQGSFARLADALATEFRYILPSGALIGRQTVLDNIFAAHGTHSRARIEIRNLIWPAEPVGTLALAFFEEHQWLDGTYDARFNTALLRVCERAPEGVEWVHLHETPQSEPAPKG